MKLICCGFLLISYLNLVQPDDPSEKTKCKLRDSGCIVKYAQLKVPTVSEGIPNLGIQSIDPMIIDFLSFDVAGLKMDLYEAFVRGFKNAVIDKMNIDIVSRQVKMVYHTDFILKSLYKADGAILNMPFNGDGVMEICAKNMQVELLMPFELIKDALGRDVVDLKGLQYSFDIKDDIRFNFTNLFYGDKAQSDPTHEFLHKNWKMISKTYGGPFLDVVHARIFNSIRSFLLSQPILEMFSVGDTFYKVLTFLSNYIIL